MLEKLRKAVQLEVVPLQGRGATLALVVFNFFNAIKVSAFLRRSTKDGGDYYLGWPGYKDRNGQWRDSVRPVSGEVANALLTLVKEAYGNAARVSQKFNPSSDRQAVVNEEDWPL